MRRFPEKAREFFRSLPVLVRLVGQRPTVREVETAIACRKSRHFSSGMAALVVREAIFHARKHDLNTKSAALTYSCILSMAPLLATAFFFFQWFGGFDLLINQTLIPLISSYFSSSVAEQLKQYLQIFVANFKPGLLGAVAIATFLVTIIGLLSSIERAVNDIFSVETHRPLWRQALNYWLVLTLTPLIVVFSTSKTTQALANFHEIARILDALSFLGIPLTIMAQGLGFSLLFYLLPNRRIPMKALLYGGFTAGVLFRLLQYVNVFLTRNVLFDSTATRLYGTAPIIAVAFFFWIKLVWLVVLAGACLSVAIMTIEEVASPSRDSAAPMDNLLLCTSLFASICAAFRRTGEGLPMAALPAALDSDSTELNRWLRWLERRRVIFSAEVAGIRHFFPTHHGLRLEKDPSQFIEKVLLSRPGSESSNESEPREFQSPFVERVHALLRGGAAMQLSNNFKEE